VELLEKEASQSDPSTLYMRVNYRCPGHAPAWETWMYQEEQGKWKRARVIPGRVSNPKGNDGLFKDGQG
jgi:hypothetical protein